MRPIIDFLAAGGVDISNLPQPLATSAKLQTILNIVFTIMGAVAVLILTLSGMRMIFSQGNPQDVAKARNGVLYAIIGLVVIVSAAAIVNFVILEVAG